MPRKIKCLVESIIDHGSRVYTVDLCPEVPVPRFRPGQFLHLTVEPYEPSGFWPESRVFSIASSPAQRNLLRICYSVKGIYTTRMEQILRPGVEVWVKMPYGDFVIDEERDVVLIAGGTGISAFISFLEDRRPVVSGDLFLVYGARSIEHFLFYQTLIRKLSVTNNLRISFFCETGWCKAESIYPEVVSRTNFFSGRIDVSRFWPNLVNPDRQTFYLSGPPAMLAVTRNELNRHGIGDTHIINDDWN